MDVGIARMLDFRISIRSLTLVVAILAVSIVTVAWSIRQSRRTRDAATQAIAADKAAAEERAEAERVRGKLQILRDEAIKRAANRDPEEEAERSRQLAEEIEGLSRIKERIQEDLYRIRARTTKSASPPTLDSLRILETGSESSRPNQRPTLVESPVRGTAEDPARAKPAYARRSTPAGVASPVLLDEPLGKRGEIGDQGAGRKPSPLAYRSTAFLPWARSPDPAHSWPDRRSPRPPRSPDRGDCTYLRSPLEDIMGLEVHHGRNDRLHPPGTA